MNVSQKRSLIEPGINTFPAVGRQCELLGLSRSAYYYEPRVWDERELAIMRALDELHMDHPYFGYRRLTSHLDACLSKDYLPVNEKMVRRLLQLMAIETLYPKPNLSKRNQEHKVFPYLLRQVPIREKRQVYSTDITYVPMAKGFMYLTAVIDWFTRFVLSWRISNTLSTDFCLEAVEEAFSKYGKPQVFNTDQGSQYTSKEFVALILGNDVRFSMDGKGRALDNVYIERFWRSVKQEYVYIFVPESGQELHNGLEKYFDFYNFKRKHQSINDQIPGKLFLDQNRP
jgi:putative transposase